MKNIRTLFVFALLIILSTSSYAGESNSSYKAVKPRYFCEKLYISTEHQQVTECTLFVFGEDGEVITELQIDLTQGEFIHDAKKYKQGTYEYFVKLDEALVARGSFIKQ